MKVWNGILVSALLSTAVPALAHDEGHGPKLTDSGKFGGVLSAVVVKKDAGLGAKAKLQYKAELVRSSDGKVQVYVYDAAMKPLDVADWGQSAKVNAFPLKKGAKAIDFEVSFDGKSFTGKIPDGVTKPFNLDFVFTDKGRELLSAFDNLD